MSKEVGINRKTAQRLINQFREMLTAWLTESISKIGGPGEIDESAFGTRKYNRGRTIQTRCV